ELVASDPSLPEGVVIREVREAGDFARLVQLDESMSHEDHSWIDDLADERAADPQGLSIFVAEAGDRTVGDGWGGFPSGTEFATVWGGVTRAARDRRGPGADARSPARLFPTGKSSPRAAAAATSRSTPPTTAARSSTGW